MPNWEYKIITSGALGFASPQLLEQHLNQLGKEDWEIIHFQTRPDNPLAFQGLARRPVMRDWQVETVAAAAPAAVSAAVPAPPEERAAYVPTAAELQAAAEERRESLLAREESLRPLRDDAAGTDDEEEDDDWEADEDLPTFFEAIRPHLRKNQHGAGQAASVEYLAKAFKQTEGDLVEALKECGFAIPAGPKDAPAYLEFDGDLYWLNRNRRHQLWINTREKPRPVFRTVRAERVAAEEGAEGGTEPTDRGQTAAGAAAAAPAPDGGEPPPPIELPQGPELLDRLRPLMRRNRREPGMSGSIGYLARALHAAPDGLENALAALGLALPAAGAEPAKVAIGASECWLDRDKKGQTWINVRPLRPAVEPAPSAEAPAAEPPPAGSPLAAVRLLLQTTRRGGLAAEVGRVADQLHQSVDDLLAGLVDAGLKVPEKAREKPVFGTHAGEVFWLNRNAKGELWVNVKPAKSDDEGAGTTGDAAASKTSSRRPRRSRKLDKDPAG